jgi:hypothetical protein
MDFSFIIYYESIFLCHITLIPSLELRFASVFHSCVLCLFSYNSHFAPIFKSISRINACMIGISMLTWKKCWAMLLERDKCLNVGCNGNPMNKLGRSTLNWKNGNHLSFFITLYTIYPHLLCFFYIVFNFIYFIST